ncbi:MAG: hypothetical protein P9X27_06710, partial [Candidatus Kaelpia aquatica]|nr:hypothetical protein [Candidatus Kaelpia aquatica]
MKYCRAKFILLISSILIISVVFISNYAYARRVKNGSLAIEISAEDRASYIDYLQQGNLQASEKNIQLFAELGRASAEAGFSPRDTFYALKGLAETGIITEDNLSEVIELGRLSAEAGFDPRDTFDALTGLADAGIV